MAFSSAATTELEKGSTTVEWILELRTKFGGSSSWVQYEYNSRSLTFKGNIPSTLRIGAENVPGVRSDETDQTNRWQIGAEARLTAHIGSESAVKFQGRIKNISPVDYDFGFMAADWRDLINDRKCKIDMVHEDTTAYNPDEVDDGGVTYRPLAFVDGTTDGSRLGKTFGLVIGTPGTDEGFGENSPYFRKAWVPGNETIWYDQTGTNEVSQTLFKIQHSSGAMSILEAFSSHAIASISGAVITIAGNHAQRFLTDMKLTISGSTGDDGDYIVLSATNPTGSTTAITLTTSPPAQAGDGNIAKNYYIKDLRCFVESSATSATNCDIVNVFKEIFEYPIAKGGMGLSGSDYSLPDLGLDLVEVFHFEGRAVDMVKRMQKDFGANLVYYYDSEDQKHKVIFVSQASSTTWDLLDPQTIDQGRGDRDVHTRIEATGKVELPANILAFDGTKVDDDDTAVVTVSDLRTEKSVAGTCHKWNKTNGGADQIFDLTKLHLYDGNKGRGMGYNDLPTTENAGTHSGATHQFDSWYWYVKIDMGELRDVQRVVAHMPTSANRNQGHFQNDGDIAVFWPGIWLRISDDDVTYNDLAPALYKRRTRPSEILDIKKDEIGRPTGRYIQVICGAYKQGIGGRGTDPSIGAMELEIFTNTDYRIVKEIDSNASPATFYQFTTSKVLPIIGVSTGSETFTIDLDYTALFVAGYKFAVVDSTGNNDVWTVDSSTLTGGDTVITVTGDITGATVDGNILTAIVQRNQPDLFTRYGGFRHKELPLGNRYNEYLSNDAALLQYQEALKLFQHVSDMEVTDPRIKFYQTIGVPDELNGDITSILVDDTLTFADNGDTIAGTNYLSGELGT